LPEFFRNFWIRRMALDRRNHKQVVETTEELANKVGCSDIIGRIVDDLKDDSEPYRRMVMETVQKVLTNLGAGDIDERLEERLIDGILYAFQEQAVDATSSGLGSFGKDGQIMLDGFGTVVNALGERCKPYLKQIAGTIKWRLNNKSASVRMQAADLIGRIAVVMKACGEDQLMGHLGVVLYEYLGEEYPEVLGSILGALRAIINVIGMTKMTPPIQDLLPRLTPILRNRHEKVQENCIDLVSSIFCFECTLEAFTELSLIQFLSRRLFCTNLAALPNFITKLNHSHSCFFPLYRLDVSQIVAPSLFLPRNGCEFVLSYLRCSRRTRRPFVALLLAHSATLLEQSVLKTFFTPSSTISRFKIARCVSARPWLLQSSQRPAVLSPFCLQS
jgi:hypothetical protein